MTAYYDVILALIPAALVGVTAALLLAGFSFTVAVPVGASLSVLLIGHAMFVRSPVTPADGPSAELRGGSMSDVMAD